MRLVRQVLAVFCGLIVGGLCTFAIERISIALFPIPAEAAEDPAALREFIKGLPATAFLLVLAAWTVGSFAAPLVARSIAADRSMTPGLVAWTLNLVAILANLVSIPHPWWMAIAAPILSVAVGMLALALVAPRSFNVRSERMIEANTAQVFDVISSPDRFAEAVPGIEKIEFLSEERSGVGTRFRETRIMNGKKASSILEIQEWVANERVLLSAQAGGTVWDSLFIVKQVDQQTQLQLILDARPLSLFARLVTPLLLQFVLPAIESDMKEIKQFCERQE